MYIKYVIQNTGPGPQGVLSNQKLFDHDADNGGGGSGDSDSVMMIV